MFRTTCSSIALLLASAGGAQTSVTVNYDHARHRETNGRSDINFATASWHIAAEAEDRVRELCDRIAADRPARVVLTGHTDRRGSLDYNIDLSRQRTEAVRDALQRCAPDVAFELNWQGEQLPLLPAEETDDVVENRRVEVAWEIADASCPAPVAIKGSSRFEPLIPGAAVPFQTTTVDASQPIAWTTAEGVTVRIAAGAVLDADGNPVSAPIDLAFRAFTDPWQTVASGIPMHVRTANGVEHMESAYMVELLATRNGEQLELAEGQVISYDLPPTVEVAPDFDTFTIDEATGDWRNNGAFANDTARAMTPAVQRYVDRYYFRWRDRDRDTTSFDARAESNAYCGTVACMPEPRPYTRLKTRIGPPSWSSTAISIDMLPARQTYHMHLGLRLRWHSSRSEHPEWKAFPKDMTWAYTGDLSRKALRDLLVRRHYYQDVRFSYDEPSGAAAILLKDRGQWVELPVSAALADASLKEEGGLSACLRVYSKELALRRSRFDQTMHRRGVQVRTEDQRHRTYAYNSAQPIMTSTEVDIAASEYHDHALAEHSKFAAIRTNQQGNKTVERTLVAAGFGLCNIDRLINYNNVQQMIARFETPDGEPFKWTVAYALNSKRNAVVTLFGTGGTEQPIDIAKGRMDWLFLSNGKGDVAIVDGTELRGGDEVVVVPCKPVKTNGNMAELQALAKR